MGAYDNGQQQRNCPDCGMPTAQAHDGGCEVARCMVTGMQRMQCDGRDHDCGTDVWSGRWPAS